LEKSRSSSPSSEQRLPVPVGRRPAADALPANMSPRARLAVCVHASVTLSWRGYLCVPSTKKREPVRPQRSAQLVDGRAPWRMSDWACGACGSNFLRHAHPHAQGLRKAARTQPDGGLQDHRDRTRAPGARRHSARISHRVGMYDTHGQSYKESRRPLSVQTRSGHAISVITSEQNGAKKLTELDVQNKQQMLDVVPVPPDLITRPAVRCCLHCTLVSSGASCCLHVTPAGLWDSWRLLAEAGRPQLVFHTLCA
jgi:hypothetical protein